MEILRTVSDAHRWRRGQTGSVGLVPTMGFLHEGHLALVRRALAENDAVAVSIFVNPTQFGPNEDFERYPRDEERDRALLRDAGVHALYMPSVEAMYPEGFQTYVTVEQLTARLEGAARPGHFRGVATIVAKLFHALSPDRAYFGRKDAQQLRVIRRMVADLDMPVEVVACDIVRERDGLAMSSRNVYLSKEQRKAAPVIFEALRRAHALYNDGERDADVLRETVTRRLLMEPLATIDYVSLADSGTLEELHGPVQRPALLSVAVRFGTTRLIDNIELG